MTKDGQGSVVLKLNAWNMDFFFWSATKKNKARQITTACASPDKPHCLLRTALALPPNQVLLACLLLELEMNEWVGPSLDG